MRSQFDLCTGRGARRAGGLLAAALRGACPRRTDRAATGVRLEEEAVRQGGAGTVRLGRRRLRIRFGRCRRAWIGGSRARSRYRGGRSWRSGRAGRGCRSHGHRLPRTARRQTLRTTEACDQWVLVEHDPTPPLPAENAEAPVHLISVSASRSRSQIPPTRRFAGHVSTARQLRAGLA